jgi:hypothetical protein
LLFVVVGEMARQVGFKARPSAVETICPREEDAETLIEQDQTEIVVRVSIGGIQRNRLAILLLGFVAPSLLLVEFSEPSETPRVLTFRRWARLINGLPQAAQ